jgi:hypothetical protein
VVHHDPPGPTTLARMRKSAELPLAIVSLLTVLAIGAAILGLSQAPSTADLTVHNGTGETLQNPDLTAIFRSNSPAETVRVVVRASDRVSETLLEGGPGGAPLRTVSRTGSKAVTEALQPLSALLKISGFAPRGSSYVATQQASTLVSPAEASEVSGSINYIATVRDGYLVALVERYRVTVPGGTESGTDYFRITDIGGRAAPAI